MQQEIRLIPKSSITQILKEHKWHQCKIRLENSSNDADPDRKIEFCDIIYLCLLEEHNNSRITEIVL